MRNAGRHHGVGHGQHCSQLKVVRYLQRPLKVDRNECSLLISNLVKVKLDSETIQFWDWNYNVRSNYYWRQRLVWRSCWSQQPILGQIPLRTTKFCSLSAILRTEEWDLTHEQHVSNVSIVGQILVKLLSLIETGGFTLSARRLSLGLSKYFLIRLKVSRMDNATDVLVSCNLIPKMLLSVLRSHKEHSKNLQSKSEPQ